MEDIDDLIIHSFTDGGSRRNTSKSSTKQNQKQMTTAGFTGVIKAGESTYSLPNQSTIPQLIFGYRDQAKARQQIE